MPFFLNRCVHLVAELSQINELSVQICELLPLLHETVTHRHYTHHVCILESLCKQVIWKVIWNLPKILFIFVLNCYLYFLFHYFAFETFVKLILRIFICFWLKYLFLFIWWWFLNPLLHMIIFLLFFLHSILNFIIKTPEIPKMDFLNLTSSPIERSPYFVEVVDW